MIEGGEDWMEPLAELRAELKETQDPEKRVQVREIKRRHGHVELFSDGSDQHTPAPYTMEFCKQFLEKLLQAQVQVRKEGPDPKMTLIYDDELHEIQRIWRMERGDWQNSVHEIYHKVTGEKLEEIKEDLSGFGNLEQELLQEICTKHDVPPLLVSKLLHAEFESQSMTRHSKIYGKINKYLTEEWREDLDEIIDDLRDERQEKKMTENAPN